RKGTTLVKPMAASSPSVNPLTFLPSTSGLPTGVFTWRSTPGAWHTSATGLLAARKDSISLMESGSSAKSHRGPCPARIEDCVIVLLLQAPETDRVVELALGISVLFEATGGVGLEVRIPALWVERRAAPP